MRRHVIVEQQRRASVAAPTIVVQPFRAPRLDDHHRPVEPVEVLEHHAEGIGAGVILWNRPRLEPRDRELLVPLPEIYRVPWATNASAFGMSVIPSGFDWLCGQSTGSLPNAVPGCS